MRNSVWFVFGIALLLSATFPLMGQNKKQSSTLDARTAKAGTAFGFDLFTQLASSQGNGNIFFSPSSISWCLSMVLNGAQGQTRTEMAQTLGVDGISITDLNRAFQNWRNSAGVIDPKVEIDVANSLWARQGSGVRPEFMELNKTFYQAEVRELNFNDPRTLDAINLWVKTKTRGKIDKIVDQVSSDSVLFLINAIYFNGKWSNAFDATDTKEEQFTTGTGQKKTVPMMRKRGTFFYLEEPDFQAVRLPYGNGRYSMNVFLPSTGSNLKSFQQKLSVNNWQTWMAAFEESEGELLLPRFRVEYETTLNQSLRALGMKSAFDPQTADFGAMVQGSGRAFISNVKHKAYADITEEGTEAAAATSTEVRVVSMPVPAKTFRMKIDRPFFFAIRDEASGLVLFLGSIQNPGNSTKS